MTDSSTSPVPPKEIGIQMERIRQNAVALDRQIARLGGNGISRLASIDDALFNLESAIASYTLSPEEARLLGSLLAAAAESQSDAFIGLTERLRPLTEKLARIAEASQ